MRNLRKSEWLVLWMCVNVAVATTLDNTKDAAGVIEFSNHLNTPELRMKQLSFDAKQIRNYVNNLGKTTYRNSKR